GSRRAAPRRRSRGGRTRPRRGSRRWSRARRRRAPPGGGRSCVRTVRARSSRERSRLGADLQPPRFHLGGSPQALTAGGPPIRPARGPRGRSAWRSSRLRSRIASGVTSTSSSSSIHSRPSSRPMARWGTRRTASSWPAARMLLSLRRFGIAHGDDQLIGTIAFNDGKWFLIFTRSQVLQHALGHAFLQVLHQICERYLAFLVCCSTSKGFDQNPRKIALLLLFEFVSPVSNLRRVEGGECLDLPIADIEVEAPR